jgi:hypothetical protein
MPPHIKLPQKKSLNWKRPKTRLRDEQLLNWRKKMMEVTLTKRRRK